MFGRTEPNISMTTIAGILALRSAGMQQVRVAAFYGITQQAVSRIELVARRRATLTTQ
jgi:transcriptional regulator